MFLRNSKPGSGFSRNNMAELGLTTYRERHPNTLSGGQKQRVAVAVSMICGKDLLVFDEPTSGLDFDSMAQVAGLIKRLSEQGKSFLLSPMILNLSAVPAHVSCILMKGNAG